MKVNGILLMPARPANAHKAIEEHSTLFAGDMIHWAQSGHEFTADRILKKLQEINFRTKHDSTVQPWGAIDSCVSWFKTGITSLTHHPLLVMNEFKPGKFALEARSESTWIKVFNDNKETAELSLEYMNTSPDCLYPTAQITIVSGGTSKDQYVLAECRKLHYRINVHVTEQIHVGKVEPGESVFRISVLGKGPWPFRILGVALMPSSNLY
jgi:hypothetical protein